MRDRATGRLFAERVFGEGQLGFLYGTRRGRALLRLIATRSFSALYGLGARSGRSRARIAGFVESLGIDPSEAERPLAEYRTLDEFFTRRLRPGARPVDEDPDHLVSPADGRALAWEALPERIEVKGSRADLARLLGDRELARRYAGGAGLLVRLAPADYHRFHFPDAGVAGPPRTLGGPLHSVHPIALAAGAPSLLNRRVVTRLESRGFGPVLLVEVGALVVGTIVQTHAPGPVARGQEKGTFRFGGSTVIALLEPGRVRWDEDLLASTREGVETLVRMGTRVGVRP